MAILATNKNRSGTSTWGIHTRACSSGVASAEHRQRWSSFCRAGPDQLEGRIPFFLIPFFPNPVFSNPVFRIPFFPGRARSAGLAQPSSVTHARNKIHYVRDGARVSGGPGPALIGGRNFLFPVCGQNLLEEIRLGHSSAEWRPGIADVKNGVTGRVRFGLSVTELQRTPTEGSHQQSLFGEFFFIYNV